MATINGKEIIALIVKGHLTKLQQNKVFLKNGEYSADTNFDGFGKVTVAVPTFITVQSEEELNVTPAEDGTIAVVEAE